MKKYSRDVKVSLEQLTKKAKENHRKRNLQNMSESFSLWKKGELSDKQMEERLASFLPIEKEWKLRKYREGSDPGLPVVDALLNGYLEEDDLNDEVRKELEILMHVMNI